ncbi:MAG: hypothetical protein AB1704_20850 [Pseudomonadota bacterium]
MKKFSLLCPDRRTSVPDELIDQLRILPGVHLNRVTSGVVSVYFDGTEGELHALLAETAWTEFYVGVSESCMYRM